MLNKDLPFQQSTMPGKGNNCTMDTKCSLTYDCHTLTFHTLSEIPMAISWFQGSWTVVWAELDLDHLSNCHICLFSTRFLLPPTFLGCPFSSLRGISTQAQAQAHRLILRGHVCSLYAVHNMRMLSPWWKWHTSQESSKILHTTRFPLSSNETHFFFSQVSARC